VNCASDREYVCKLHCIRQAFEHLFKNEKNSMWFSDCGRRILTDIFLFAEKVIFFCHNILCYTIDVLANKNIILF